MSKDLEENPSQCNGKCLRIGHQTRELRVSVLNTLIIANAMLTQDLQTQQLPVLSLSTTEKEEGRDITRLKERRTWGRGKEKVPGGRGREGS